MHAAFKCLMSLSLVWAASLACVMAHAAEDRAPAVIDAALYRSAVSGTASSQVAIGRFYNNMRDNPQPDPVLAAKWYKMAADQGDAAGQSYLGGCYFFGDGVPQNYDMAFKLYRLAADQGNAHALFSLGGALVEGRGVVADPVEGARLIRLAAEQGLEYAQFSLAQMYSIGQGVSSNDAEAFRWYLKVADQGETVSQIRVANLLHGGIGTPRDSVAALMWAELAAMSGYDFVVKDRYREPAARQLLTHLSRHGYPNGEA